MFADIEGNLLLATSQKGILRSTDDGSQWNEFNEGLDPKNITTITQTVNESIFIGTEASGLWGHILWVSVPFDEDNSFDLTISPNPVSAITNISFNSAGASDIKVRLFDNMGNLVRELLGNGMSIGNNIIPLNCEGLPDGAYHLVLESDKEYAVQKLIIMK
jgi:ligand-binding sensor domain-containing protein